MPPPPYNSKGFKPFRLGFTLAETLITLAIIGIIAALTVPTLTRKYQEHQTVIAVKEAYSILSQAFKMAQVEHGSFDTWDIGTSGWTIETTIKSMNYFIPYFKLKDKTLKTCKQIGYTENFKNLTATRVNLDCNSSKADYFVALENGMYFSVLSGVRTPGENVLIFTVDINGKKGPNTKGKDLFIFRANKDNILYPSGLKNMIGAGEPEDAFSKFCSPTSDNQYNGHSCTAWVIYKGNMDYLRREISWDESD